MLLRRIETDANTMSTAMLMAAGGEHCGVLALLLEHWSRFEATAESDGTEAGNKSYRNSSALFEMRSTSRSRAPCIKAKRAL